MLPAHAAAARNINIVAENNMKTYFRMLKWLLPHIWPIILAATFLCISTVLSFASIGAFIPLIDIKFAPDGGLASLKKIHIENWPYGEQILSFFTDILSKGDDSVILMLAGFIVCAVIIRCIADFIR